MLKYKYKKQILKVARGKGHITHRGPTIWNADNSSEKEKSWKDNQLTSLNYRK